MAWVMGLEGRRRKFEARVAEPRGLIQPAFFACGADRVFSHIPILSLADIQDPEMGAAAIASTIAAGLAGWLAADRLHLIGWLRATAAGVGAASAWLTCVPSMIIFGSIGGGVYALLCLPLHLEIPLLGKTFVVAATAMGCALVAWLGSMALFAAPAVLDALHRRSHGERDVRNRS